MTRDFRQIEWDQLVEDDCRALVRLAVREDLEREQDWTTVALVPADREGAAHMVTREPGVVAGMPAVATVLDEMQAQVDVALAVADGDVVSANTRLATLRGNVRDLLTCERTLLNLVGRLMGIATLARAYAEQVRGTSARVYDTRKTTAGWRRLEKYAVRCGGACNHRTGLYDAILIKDNHLAQSGPGTEEAADAVRRVRQFAKDYQGPEQLADLLIEVEVDTLEQLAAVLPTGPDLVLLDNMPPEMLRQAVEMRDAQAPQVELEASGGVRLETLREIASSGVDRISVGALTHSARSLDIGLDWQRG
ncbi:MAG: carboxylating nicotinate-nucleotide diphosphorylase [Planctomycetes bacterium]|nr:carboxylating nicotinate-nucleotide diphosphorylase [Planctomycetota bacterium]